MSQSSYISRPQAESVVDRLDLALKNPGAYPGLFNVWGVGKSTFLRRVMEAHPEAGVAIASLQRAIELDASYREMAKTDTDFDGIRDNEEFQALIGI